MDASAIQTSEFLINEYEEEEEDWLMVKPARVNAKQLPDHIWENILSGLPISSLLKMKSVCKSWRTIINSNTFLTVYKKLPPQDLYFFLFADYIHKSIAAAYNPTDNKWVLIPLSHISSSCPSTCCKLRRPIVSHGGLILAEDRKGSLVLFNPFTKTCRTLPPMMPMKWPYVVAMMGSYDSSFKILAISTTDKISSQVYDYGRNLWEMSGEFDGRFAMIGSAACLNGFLFCLSHGPDYLLAYDIRMGTWDLVNGNASIPHVSCSYISEYQGSLILVGGVEEHGAMKSIDIFEFDMRERIWRLICRMPHHLFIGFGLGKLSHFVTVAHSGRICFYKNSTSSIMMYDMPANRWSLLPPCPLDSCLNRPLWFGLAVEPRMDVFV
ncbi:hypothetical protein AMTRI_Chr11g98230 [Amborella trichopoda]|uniref:F-box domain-containing protein n=1 Tax=Amborella trichopoda TaxID=13333 RepID=W1PL85_AMBTC|nr:F-box/kelch-repeat protein At5g15710 [Amborella trichopoda]ERN08534.1 hypothetical protein AMTR_s00017p00033560 [Amborella trichopoda]|eukprot:XP_006846953.1 F-box/kelch-repeat protein At5g15710 [Amborella trichopoda]